MKHIIQFKIYKGDKYFVGEGIDVPVVTQGNTIDEVISNIKEALLLYLEGENLADLDIAPSPSALVNFELEPLHA
jgi:predicted RNase H-like HicB family nuclease